MAPGHQLKRVFEEPQTFDLILWIRGSAAADYLEEGELTRDFSGAISRTRSGTGHFGIFSM